MGCRKFEKVVVFGRLVFGRRGGRGRSTKLFLL